MELVFSTQSTSYFKEGGLISSSLEAIKIHITGIPYISYSFILLLLSFMKIFLITSSKKMIAW